ncbi:hypothetical protein TYRP_003040, partial [Tyrophagus putrescentiae]
RLTLTTLGHCERPPTRAPLAPLARPSRGVHSAQVSSDLAALGSALLPPQQLTKRRNISQNKRQRCAPPYSLCFLTALQPRPKTVAAASVQSLSQHFSCRDSDTRARGSQSQRRIATDNVPNFLGFL